MSDDTSSASSYGGGSAAAPGSSPLSANRDGRGTVLEAKRNYMRQGISLVEDLFGDTGTSARSAGLDAAGRERMVPRYRTPAEILRAYRSQRGRDSSEKDVVDTQLLLLEDLVNAEGGGDERYVAPRPPAGVPGLDRRLVLDDIVVNMDGYENSREAVDLLNETPDYVITFSADPDEIKSVRWGDGPLDAEVMRYSADPQERYARHRQLVVGSLRKVGLIVRQERRGETVYVLVWGPEEVLERRAEDLGLKVPLRAGLGNKRFLSQLGYPVAPGLPLFSPSNLLGMVGGSEERALQEAVSLPFSVGDRWMFQRLEPSTRLRLIHSLIEGDRDVGGAGLPIEHLATVGKVEKFFAVHDKREQAILRRDWVFSTAPTQPIARVRAYFGVKVALYFAWLGYYAYWLWGLAFVGLGVFVYGVIIGSQDNILTPWYAALLVLWITLFMEFWKRHQSTLAFKWNMLDYKDEETAQPTFVGTPTYGFYGRARAGFLRLDPTEYDRLGISRSAIPRENYSPGIGRVYRLVFSGCIQILALMVSVLITLSILALRAHLSDKVDGIFEPDFNEDDVRWGAIAAGILMGITIAVLNAVWKVIARKLTHWENHRTAREHEFSLILKIFLVQSVTSYLSLFYTGFLKEEGIIDEWFGVRDKCDAGGCLTELSYQLASIMVTQMLLGQIIENIVPFAMRHGRLAFFMSSNKAASNSDLREYERQAALDVSLGVVDEYAEMVLQIGYISIFASAFPLGAVLALVNNLIEIRTDANKFVKLNRRPHWEGARDIGAWYPLIQLIGLVAVVTNATIVAFVSTQLQDEYFSEGSNVTEGNRWVVAVVAEHIVLLLKLVIMFFTPDVPRLVRRYIALEEEADRVTLRASKFKNNFSWPSTPAAKDRPIDLDRVAPTKGAVVPRKATKSAGGGTKVRSSSIGSSSSTASSTYGYDNDDDEDYISNNGSYVDDDISTSTDTSSSSSDTYV